MTNDGISYAREYVLTHVPAEDRMAIQESMDKRIKRILRRSIVETILAFSISIIVNWVTDDDPFIYGYIAGMGIMFYSTIAIIYLKKGLFSAPTQQEMDKIGDRII